MAVEDVRYLLQRLEGHVVSVARELGAVREKIKWDAQMRRCVMYAVGVQQSWVRSTLLVGDVGH